MNQKKCLKTTSQKLIETVDALKKGTVFLWISHWPKNPAMIAASTAKKRRNKLSEKTSNPLHKDSDLAKYQLQLGYPTSCEPQCYFFADDCQEVECAKLGEFTKPIDIDPMMIMLMSTKPQVKSRSAGEVNHWSSSKISKKSVSWKKAAIFTEVFKWKLNLASAAQMTHAFRPWVCSSWSFFPQLAPRPCHTSNQSTTNIRGDVIYQNTEMLLSCHRVAPLWYSKNCICLSWWGSSWKWCPNMAVFMRNLINHWIWEVPTEFSDKPGRTQSHVLMIGFSHHVSGLSQR